MPMKRRLYIKMCACPLFGIAFSFIRDLQTVVSMEGNPFIEFKNLKEIDFSENPYFFFVEGVLTHGNDLGHLMLSI